VDWVQAQCRQALPTWCAPVSTSRDVLVSQIDVCGKTFRTERREFDTYAEAEEIAEELEDVYANARYTLHVNMTDAERADVTPADMAGYGYSVFSGERRQGGGKRARGDSYCTRGGPTSVPHPRPRLRSAEAGAWALRSAVGTAGAVR
jgi:hypothetical protein